MKLKIFIISIISVLVLLPILMLFFNYAKIKNDNIELSNKVKYYESIINDSRHVADSIEYNIIRKDSIIINIEKEMYYEKELAQTYTTDESVVMFNKLVWD